MVALAGSVAILTGASRGIGPFIARALAARGVKLALIARSQGPLALLAQELGGADALALPADLGDHRILPDLVAQVERALGPVDLLINNAAVEQSRRYQDMATAEVHEAIAVNLTGPMLLGHAVLPGMIRRRCGHIVNVASLASFGGPPYQESYAATKHGLLGFTRSLRASAYAEGHGVSASVVCPGFVSDAGMYHDMQQQTGIRATGKFAASSPQQVAAAVIRAVVEDVPEILVNSGALRPLMALAALSPRFGEWYGKRSGMLELFKRVADSRQTR